MTNRVTSKEHVGYVTVLLKFGVSVKQKKKRVTKKLNTKAVTVMLHWQGVTDHNEKTKNGL